MLRLLRLLFIGDAHVHKWEQVERNNIYPLEGEMPIPIEFILRCTHCGNMKSFRT